MRAIVVALILALALPSGVSAGPLKEAVEKAGREPARAQDEPGTRSRTRFWTGIGLITGGVALVTMGGLEIGDDESGPDDGEDFDNSDDGEDSDGWDNKAMLGGGIAAATIGGIVLVTGGGRPKTVVSARQGRLLVKHTVRF